MPETVTAPAAAPTTTVKPPPGGGPGREVTPPASAPGTFPDAFADIDSAIAAPAPVTRTARERTAARIAASDKSAPVAPTPAAAPSAPATKPPETPTAAKPAEPAPAASKPAETPAPSSPAPETPKLPTDEDLEALRHTAGFHVAKDLRRELYRTRKLADEREARVKALEASAGKPPDESKLKAAEERLAAHEKRIAEYETELRHANYTRSQEYREKFETPYKEEYAEAVELMGQLEVELPDGATRAATEKDLQDILAMSEGAAARESKKFGAADSLVMRRYEALRKISRDAQRAVERYKKEGGEREAARAAEAQRNREVIDRAWQDAQKDVVTRHPEWFGTRENDNDWNDRLEKGFAEVDRANNPDLPVQERIARQAAVRARAAAFGPLLRERDALKTRVAELEADLAEYERSEPGAGSKTGGGEPQKPREESADDMIDAMARGA